MKELQDDIKKYVEERNWSVFEHPSNIAKSISIESAELLELFQWKNHSVSEIHDNPDLYQKIKAELGDVLIYALEMAIALDMDVKDVVAAKLEYNKKKYPADQIKGNQEEYYRIKQSYRDEK